MRSFITASLIAMIAPVLVAQSFQGALTGKRLILEDAQCAGWDFRTDGTVLRFDELNCTHGVEPTLKTRVRWVAPDQFLLVESSKDSGNPGCPPRVWFYKVQSIVGLKVTLKEIWLGWGQDRESAETYRVKQ
jgi:hypothetical protein